MWMREAPAGDADAIGVGAPTIAGGPLPTLAGGSPELDDSGVQPEVALVAVLAGAATIFFGIIPQPLFDLVHQAGGALSGLF
jgi:hypothetical protein